MRLTFCTSRLGVAVGSDDLERSDRFVCTRILRGLDTMNEPASLGLAITVQWNHVNRLVAQVLLSRARRIPVVGLSPDKARGHCLIDPSDLAIQLRGIGQVVVFESDEVTRQMADLLPAGLAVWGGAARVWWTGLCHASRPEHHPLFTLAGPDDAKPVMDAICWAIRNARHTDRSPGIVDIQEDPLPAAEPNNPTTPDGRPKRGEVPWDKDSPLAGDHGWWHADW